MIGRLSAGKRRRTEQLKSRYGSALGQNLCLLAVLMDPPYQVCLQAVRRAAQRTQHHLQFFYAESIDVSLHSRAVGSPGSPCARWPWLD